ncbi:MAG: hypothetical protein U5N10_08355 [Gemmobacter sp.]|nr:hypothetical protein [Gemmobacter sp.]
MSTGPVLVRVRLAMTQLIETTLAIIAVDRPASKDKEKAADSFAVPRAMTVAATPEQVARLAQAQATGQLSVSLVAQNDGAPSDRSRRRIDLAGKVAAGGRSGGGYRL